MAAMILLGTQHSHHACLSPKGDLTGRPIERQSAFQGCMSGSTPVTVLVTDTCDDCATTQLNINALAFEQHFQNNLGIGQVNVQWQQVRQLCWKPEVVSYLRVNAK